MTFTITFLTRRPGGRVSQKSSKVDKDELVIGRATDCDIFLPALGVALHHALLRREETGIEVETVGEKPIRAGGQVARRKRLGFGEKNAFEIASFRLYAEDGDAPGETVIFIEKLEVSEESFDAADEEKIFSLNGVTLLPGKRSTAWVLSLAAAAFFLVLPILHFAGGKDATPEIAGMAGDRSWLSGSMSLAHANLVDDCAACHKQAFSRVSDVTCLECHTGTMDHAEPKRLDASEPVPAPIDQATDLFRTALSIPEGRCGSCHMEHNGRDGMILEGAGLCADCHRDLDGRLTDTALLNAGDFGDQSPRIPPDHHHPARGRRSGDRANFPRAPFGRRRPGRPERTLRPQIHP